MQPSSPRTTEDPDLQNPPASVTETMVTSQASSMLHASQQRELLAPPYNPYLTTVGEGDASEGTAMNMTREELIQEEEEEPEEEEESVFSGRDEMEVLEKHVQSLLNPHDTRDVLLRLAGCTVLSILLIVLIVSVSDLSDKNERIRSEGTRVTVAATCATRLPEHIAPSWGIDKKLHPALSVDVGLADIIALSPFLTSNAGILSSVKGTSELPPLPSKTIIIASSDPARSEVGFAVSSHGNTGFQNRYSFALNHDDILAIQAHGVQQHSGEWDVLVIFTQNGTLQASTVSIRSDGTLNVNQPVVFLGKGADDFFSAVYLKELPLRYVVVVGVNGVCEYHVLEASSTNHLSELFSRVSSHALCAQGNRVETSPIGPDAFIILTNTVVLHTTVTSQFIVEKNGASVQCVDGLVSLVTDTAAVVVCSDLQTYLLGFEGGFLTVLPVFNSPPQVGFKPVSLYKISAHEALVIGRFQKGSFYTAHKIFIDSVTNGVFVSDIVRLGLQTSLVSVGVHGSVFALLNGVSEELHFYPLTWVGGLRTAGVTLRACEAGGNTDLIVQGVLTAPPRDAVLPGYPIFADGKGLLTSAVPEAALYRALGRSLSDEVVFIDVVTR
eukprot:TRINITY_DN359_c5_g1_i1.p1 TRINITY_DN359_c5_g1~~TRINITY_DN359_c5_g1_i1.p1  ORF type:complete len:639 (+),score=99.52 TRINITY_DN359_c5_g1_i1:87-1919(+)